MTLRILINKTYLMFSTHDNRQRKIKINIKLEYQLSHSLLNCIDGMFFIDLSVLIIYDVTFQMSIVTFYLYCVTHIV